MRLARSAVSSSRSVIRYSATGAIEAMPVTVPQPRGTLVLPGCGHWTAQERPAEVTEAVLEFLRSLPADPGGERPW